VAAVLETETGIRAEVVEGPHGSFDVAVDGEVVYSRAKTGELPSSKEVVALVRAREG
jgi:selT/selW/selH-like putative selenoprotein